MFAATASFVDEGKADDGTGGLCLLSSQCGAGLVCRPDMHFINRCMRPGQLGEHCWSASQCANGMSCHWIWHDVEPLAHPARVCNPHQNAEHVHQPHDDLPGHEHTVPARLDPTRSYGDRVRVLTVLRDRHPYPFHGTGNAWFDHRDGLLAQTLWQDESGRDTRRADGVHWSWWGNINWTLTMWQAQVLQRYRGELPGLTIVSYTDPRFDIPQSVVTAVLELYDAIDQTRRDAEAGRLDAAGRSAAEWKLQQLMWRFHDEVLKVSLPRNDDVLAA
ncbi:MAG TPA: EB domain-containing protein, partial [Kofleriaceae bacterium]